MPRTSRWIAEVLLPEGGVAGRAMIGLSITDGDTALSAKEARSAPELKYEGLHVASPSFGPFRFLTVRGVAYEMISDELIDAVLRDLE